MDWLKGAAQAAQDAAQQLMHSEAAAKAKEMAQTASQQARLLAEQATEKAKVREGGISRALSRTRYTGLTHDERSEMKQRLC